MLRNNLGMVYNYRALRRAAPQQNLINDGDYMTEKKTQQPLGVASDLNAELDLTSDDLDNLRHMVGAVSNVPKRLWGYRNHFAAGESDVPSMEKLRKAGFVVRGRKFHIGETDYYYHATLNGCKAIGLSKAATKRALEDW